MSSQQIPTPPAGSAQTGNWLYDAIMAGIEPDLTSVEIENLEEKYKGETKRQRVERLAHYEKAFLVFDEIYGKVAEECEQDAHAAQMEVQHERQEEEAEEHQREARDVEQHFDTDI